MNAPVYLCACCHDTGLVGFRVCPECDGNSVPPIAIPRFVEETRVSIDAPAPPAPEEEDDDPEDTPTIEPGEW